MDPRVGRPQPRPSETGGGTAAIGGFDCVPATPTISRIVEIVVHGRERDVPGTRDLIQRVAEGMRGASGGPVQP